MATQSMAKASTVVAWEAKPTPWWGSNAFERRDAPEKEMIVSCIDEEPTICKRSHLERWEDGP